MKLDFDLTFGRLVYFNYATNETSGNQVLIQDS